MGDILWTIQKKSVLEIIEKDGVYYPDNKKSSFVAENPKLLDLYQKFTDVFNYNNDTECTGLIFSFLGCENKDLVKSFWFESYEEFRDYMKINAPGKIDALWKKIATEDSVVVGFENDRDLDTLIIDINDFQFLMPPVIPFPPYPIDAEEELLYYLESGGFDQSYLPSGILQEHSPYILKDKIVGVYDVFSI